MKTFGNESELVATIFRANSQAITLRPNQATTYTASRDLQLPPGDTAHILVSDTSTQTFTNKTLTAPVINSPTGIVKADVGLGNVDNTSDSTKNAAAVTLTNKSLSDSTTAIVDVSDATKQIKFDAAGTTSTSTTLLSSQTANRTLTLPDTTDTLVGKATTDTLTNKTLSGNIATTLVSGAATVTLPTVTGTLATLAGTETLTNKTLSGNIAVTLVSGAATATLPTTTGTLATLANAETLTNKTINGSNNTITNVSLTTGVTGTLPIANGGTGQTSANAALNALLPSQTSNSGKLLTTDGTNSSWAVSTANIVAPAAYTPTFVGLGTVTNISVYQSRIGSKLRVRGSFKIGTATAVTATMSLPATLNIDATVNTSGRTLLGSAVLTANAAGGAISANTAAVIYDTATTTVGFTQTTEASAGGTVFAAQTGSTIFNANGNVAINFEVDIAGWT